MDKRSKKKDNLYWHSAFATGLRYELDGYTDQLQIETEHQLSKEALRIDMLVIKKAKELEIEKNIGRIFKEHNIIEYKSPSDYLSISDYNKVKGYAYLYSAFENITPQQITVTFIVPEINDSLKSYLLDIEGFEIDSVDDGILYIKDSSFSVQVIEQRKLSVDKNLFVATLNKAVTAVNLSKLLNELSRQNVTFKNNPFVEVVTRANPKTFKEAVKMQAEQTFEEVVRELGAEIGLTDNMHRMKEIAKKMLNVGDPLEKIALITDLDIETIKGLK